MNTMRNRKAALASAVAAARLNKGWSKERAAQKAEISAITWKRIEDGLNVHDVKLAAALRVLGLDDAGQPVTATDRDDRIAQLRADLDELRAALDRLEPSVVDDEIV